MLDFSCIKKCSLVSNKVLIGKHLISTDVTDIIILFREKAWAQIIVNHFWHVRSYTVLLSIANDDLRWFSCKTSGGQRGLSGISKFVSPRPRPGDAPCTALPQNVDLQNELFTRLYFYATDWIVLKSSQYQALLKLSLTFFSRFASYTIRSIS